MTQRGGRVISERRPSGGGREKGSTLGRAGSLVLLGGGQSKDLHPGCSPGFPSLCPHCKCPTTLGETGELSSLFHSEQFQT